MKKLDLIGTPNRTKLKGQRKTYFKKVKTELDNSGEWTNETKLSKDYRSMVTLVIPIQSRRENGLRGKLW